MSAFSNFSIAALLVGFHSMPAAAKTQTPITEEVVVSGTRTEQAYWDSPVKVTLVTRADIDGNHAMNVAEAIQNIPGLDLKAPITGKEGQSVWIQGVSADRVLVLIDGEPVSASTGSTVDITQIATTNVARIEIVKGATSALYGSSAIGGVVNIITKKPEEGLSIRLSTDAGTFGKRDVANGQYPLPSQRVDGQVSYANEKFAVQAGTNLALSNGFKSGVDEWSQPGASGLRSTVFTEGTWFATEKSSHKLRLEYYQQSLETRYLDRVGAKKYYQVKKDDAQRLSSRYKGRAESDNSLWQWGAIYEQFTNDTQPTLANTRHAEMRYGNVNAQVDTTLGLHELTHGLQFSHNSLQSIKNGDTVNPEVPYKTAASFEYYFQDHLTFDVLELLPGFRLQHNDKFGQKFTPKINGRLNLVDDEDKTIFIRAGIGQGYRVPNLKEQFFKFDHSELGYMVIGNPDLKPESSLSYQWEIGVINTEGYQIGLNLFYNDMTNLIAKKPTEKTDLGIQIHRYINIAKARTQGVELNGSYQPIDLIKITFGYSYLDAKNLTTGSRLDNRSQHQTKIQIQLFPFEGMDVGLNTRFYSKQVSYDSDLIKFTTPAYTTFDMKATYQFTDRFSLYGGVDNLTDVTRNFGESKDKDQRPVEGRYGYLGIKFEL